MRPVSFRVFTTTETCVTPRVVMAKVGDRSNLQEAWKQAHAPVTRHLATTADGARFYFLTESKARAFAAKECGEYQGIREFASVQAFMEQHS